MNGDLAKSFLTFSNIFDEGTKFIPKRNQSSIKPHKKIVAKISISEEIIGIFSADQIRIDFKLLIIFI